MSVLLSAKQNVSRFQAQAWLWIRTHETLYFVPTAIIVLICSVVALVLMLLWQGVTYMEWIVFPMMPWNILAGTLIIGIVAFFMVLFGEKCGKYVLNPSTWFRKWMMKNIVFVVEDVHPRMIHGHHHRGFVRVTRLIPFGGCEGKDSVTFENVVEAMESVERQREEIRDAIRKSVSENKGTEPEKKTLITVKTI